MSTDMVVEEQRSGGEAAKERPRLSERADAAVARVVETIVDGQGLAELFGVDSESIDALEAQAYSFYQHERFEQAVVAAHGIIALDKERPISYLILGDVALAEYRFQEAVEHLTKAFELAPDEVEFQARLGEALLKSGQVDKARPHLEAVLEALGEEKSPTAQRVRAFVEHIRK